jgi:hypothetical protein
MVTTRRSSFGIQDGDTLALRSKLTPASTDTTPSRKRKEYAVGMRSSSRKKRKSYGIDGEDDVVVAQMQGAGPASNKDGSSFAEPAPDSAHREEMGLGLGILSGKKSELEEPKSWLEDDSVSPSSKAPAPRSNVEQKHDIPEKGEPAISPEDHPIDGHGQKAEDLAMMNYRKGKKLTDHESRDEPRNTIEIVDQKPPVQRSTANMHKRFGSEEPVLIDNEGASTGLQEDEREAGSANGDEEDDTSSGCLSKPRERRRGKPSPVKLSTSKLLPPRMSAHIQKMTRSLTTLHPGRSPPIRWTCPSAHLIP